jgi:hypothetical protein
MEQHQSDLRDRFNYGGVCEFLMDRLIKSRVYVALVSALVAVVATCPVWLHSQSSTSPTVVIDGVTPVLGGTSGDCLSDNAGVVGHAACSGGGGSGVSSLNSLIGALSIAAGSNVTVTPSGSTITIAASGGGGGGLTFPLTIVQENSCGVGGNVGSYTCTFDATTASSGNTIFAACGGDGSDTVTPSSGWTIDINQTQATFARFMLIHKATASDTSVTFTFGSGSTTIGCYFFEVSGSHALDQVSMGGAAGPQVTMPSITPTSGAAVFALAGIVSGGGTSENSPPINPAWHAIAGGFLATSSARCLTGNIYAGTSGGSAITPPGLNFQGPLFSSGGVAYATFSIL